MVVCQEFVSVLDLESYIWVPQLPAYPEFSYDGIKTEIYQLAIDANGNIQQQIHSCQLKFHFKFASQAYIETFGFIRQMPCK